MWAKQGDVAVEWGPNQVVFYDFKWNNVLDLSPDSNEDEESCGDFATAHLSPDDDPPAGKSRLDVLGGLYDGHVREGTMAEMARAREAVKEQTDYWVAVPGHEGIAANSVDLAVETARKLDGK